MLIVEGTRSIAHIMMESYLTDREQYVKINGVCNDLSAEFHKEQYWDHCYS